MAVVDKKAKAELLEALRSGIEKPEEFTKYVKKHTVEQVDYQLDKALMALKTVREVSDVSDLLSKLLDVLLPAQLVENEINGVEADAEDKENEEGQSANAPTKLAEAVKAPGVLGALAGFVVVTRLLIDDGDRIAPESLWRVVCRLHDAILPMGSINASLQSQIVQLCETWYLQERDGAAQVAPQTLIWLIQSVLDKDKPASDIKRLLRFRAALKEMDIMHPSSESLRRQLKQCIAHAYLLMNSDGKKFLQFLFEIDPAFISEVHNCVKGMLAYQKRFQVEAFAEIYYKAWKNSAGHFRVTIEEVCLQDWVTCALHLRNTTALKQVNIILKYLVDQKANNRDVEGLLESLYGGVLWRSLHAANPVVRENAVSQLALVFPLIRADQRQREIDDALSTSFQRLTDCLTDPHPNVRKSAILAAGRILSFYWELLPIHTIQVILELLYESLAFDKTATSVREAVFRATLAISENPLSHSTLKTFLPKLKPLMNDASERVRSQFAALLNSVKKLKAIKFYEIVPADQILRALGAEPSEKIRSQLASILENTFFPWSRKTVNELVERSLTMLLATDATDADRRGAVAFFSSLDLSQVPVTIPVKFIGKLFLKAVLPWLEMFALKEEEDPKKRIKKQKVFEFELSVEDDEVVVGILNIISTVWGSIHVAVSKEDQQNSLEYLHDTFNDDTMQVLEAALPHCEAIYSIAARVPSSKLPNFSAKVLKKASDATFSSSASMLLQCLFSWDSEYRNKIMSTLAEWLSAPFRQQPKKDKPAPKKADGKKKGKKVTFEDDTPAELTADSVENIRSALSVISSILAGSSEWIRDELLLSDQFDEVVATLLKYKEIVIAMLEKGQSAVPQGLTDQDITNSLTMAYRVLIHRAGLDLRVSPSKKVLAEQQTQNRIEADDAEKTASLRAQAHQQISEALNWLENGLISESLPIFEDGEPLSSNELESPTEEQQLTLRVAERIFVLATDFVALGLPLSFELLEALVACAEKLVRLKLDDSQFVSAISAACWKLALFHLAVVHADSDKSEQVSLLSYDRMAVLLFQALQRDSSDDNRISIFGLRALLLQSQWSDANPYKQIFFHHVWKSLLVPGEEEFDASSSRLSMNDLSGDAVLILSTIQRSAALIKEACAFAKDVLASSSDFTLDSWRVLEFANFMIEEESDGVTVQRKLTKQTAAPLLSLVNNLATRLRESEKEEQSLKARANEIVAAINSSVSAATKA